MIRALIVDDEELARANLRFALAHHANSAPDTQWQIVAECNSAKNARELLEKNDIDVIFLDIQMPRESGLSLARSISEQVEPPLVIFVTAFNSYAIDAFELYALDYLLKPFSNQRFRQTLTRIEDLFLQRQRLQYGDAMRAFIAADQHSKSGQKPPYWQQVLVRSVGIIETIHLQDVLWIGAAGNYVELHLQQRIVLYRQTLQRMEESLAPDEFIRVHRSAIVRTDQLAQLEVVKDGSYCLHLRSGQQVMVSERYVENVRARMMNA
jgi:two-component system, LytTR family, response regulator